MSPMRQELYPDNWPEISLRIRQRAGWRCEFCGAENGKSHPETGSKVVLTVAHLDHDTAHNEDANLAALCQRCHLTYDAKYHAANAKRTRQRKNEEIRKRTGQMRLL